VLATRSASSTVDTSQSASNQLFTPTSRKVAAGVPARIRARILSTPANRSATPARSPGPCRHRSAAPASLHGGR